MAGRGGDDDDDVLFNDDSFLAAIANVEAQHLGRMTNVLAYNGPKIAGADMYGNGAPGNNIAGKRSAYWEGQNNIHGSSGQLPRGENASYGSYSEEEHRKRIRTEDEMRSSWPTNSSGQEHEARLASARQSESQEPEGEYMAALRGSNSELWQSSGVGRGIGTTAAGLQNRAGTSAGNFKGGSSGNCFKCGMEGHWSKDCTGGKVSSSPTKGAGSEQGSPSVPERLCPCGTGVCSVFTANTEKNMGRSFYRCPLRKDEGQCTFFEWCDAGGQSLPTERTNVREFNQQPQLECKCGGGLCKVLTAKTEKNMGRQFYKCPMLQSCSFFQWCDEAWRDAGGNSSTTPNSTRVTSSSGNTAGPFSARSGWQVQNSDSFSGQSQAYNAGGPAEGRNTGNCFNCGGQGHWSSSCPNTKPGGTASGYSSDCFNCGNPGHWAQNCPLPPGQRS